MVCFFNCGGYRGVGESKGLVSIGHGWYGLYR